MNIDFSKYGELAVKLRRELHKIPELGGEEFETSDFIVKTLKSWGINNIKKLFVTGISAVVGDETMPCTAIRADMDGLPVCEETEVAYKSIHQGKMHACGHDGHMAVLLTLAKLFSDNADKLKCCVKLIFQPAEETDGGALGMIKEGVLENPHVEKVFGFHLWPSVRSGAVEYSEGASFAEAERYEIHIKGNGGHGAMPEGIKNCLYCASVIINALRKTDEIHGESVVSACAVNSSGHYNVFADFAVIKGTIRTVKEGEREKIEEEIKTACKNAAKSENCEVRADFVYEYPCAVNHIAELEEIVSAAEKVLGKENVYKGKCTFAAEDFAFFTQYSKGAHIKIGTGSEKDTATLYPLHNPRFNIDENALENAVKIFAELIIG